MKNLFIIVIVIFLTHTVTAQKLDVGMTFIPLASTVDFDMKNIGVETLLWTHINFSTSKSYHILAYNFNATALVTINGWLYADDQDLYLICTKNLKDPDGYLGIGWEHTLTNGSFSPSAFVEVGTTYGSENFSHLYLSFGILMPLQYTLWKK